MLSSTPVTVLVAMVPFARSSPLWRRGWQRWHCVPCAHSLVCQERCVLSVFGV